MHLTIAVRELHPRRVFRIARPRRVAVENVFVRLEHEGIAGHGEASPNAFYSETVAGVSERLRATAPVLQSARVESVSDIERLWTELWPCVAPSRAAHCALDLALWDWLGKKLNRSVAELVWSAAPKPVTSFCTIGLSTPDELRDKVAELRGFPAIKIKSDASADLAPVRAVREALSPQVVAVDANCAWGDLDLRVISASLKELNVDFIEQPRPPAQDSLFNKSQSELPVMADESCVTEDDVTHAAARFAGFNIKLVKCGGITPALRMIQTGRSMGAKVMVGCMLESSALIAAGAVIAQQTDYSDLDGAWLLGDDPVRGWTFESGILTPPENTVGLGIEPLSELQFR